MPTIQNRISRLSTDIKATNNPELIKERNWLIHIMNLWYQFQNIPFNTKENTTNIPFIQFPAGTKRIDIENWFATTFNINPKTDFET